jgi:hypothetical protein
LMRMKLREFSHIWEGGLYMRRVRWQLAGIGDRGRGGLWHQECGYSEVSLSFVLDL